ncbi:MAG: endolytic transglycosylase MltG, partial [Patescibacteria group bacterium]|nr:endolytic transglycosylase MltG [Patescibacteria group bacterium]
VLIKPSNSFTILVRNSGMADKIQAGDFKLSLSMGAREILQQLTVGVVDKWVTLLEGWRVEEMGQVLHKELGISQDEFVKEAQEGYMFPDTYLFNPKTTVSDIVQILRDNFNKKYNSDLQAKIKKLDLTPDQGVILASIVEREARSDEVRKMVASILLKRLKIGMALNIDATIQYALISQGSDNSPSSGWWKRSLTREDLKIDSPYNTYLYPGLPPGPICNPGLSSLQAVADADPSTPYLYYYHDSQGRSHYARTLEEHNQNVATYP